eukprot:CAMPEP_0174242478 /NCGR_PEP_ID=MMETSP0417-20130205/28054_1 /TAXON_ID=242541 /ORGANISM="Mayorella sp, Strain BSH-02190019" /LENGTH=705 /DNA_ID=CAMNT_0015321877 /DNA_START=57 /DNA_END=2170 /DNA_ORIENTATION=-
MSGPYTTGHVNVPGSRSYGAPFSTSPSSPSADAASTSMASSSPASSSSSPSLQAFAAQDWVRKAIEEATRATEADRSQQYERAALHYHQACEALSTAARIEVIPARRQQLELQRKGYLERQIVLEKHIGTKANELSAREAEERKKEAASQVARYGPENEDYHLAFPQLPSSETLIEYYSCSVETVRNRGRMFISANYIGWCSKDRERKDLIALTNITTIEKNKVGLVLPGILITVESGACFQFSGFLSRDQAFDILTHLHTLSKQEEETARIRALSLADASNVHENTIHVVSGHTSPSLARALPSSPSSTSASASSVATSPSSSSSASSSLFLSPTVSSSAASPSTTSAVVSPSSSLSAATAASSSSRDPSPARSAVSPSLRSSTGALIAPPAATGLRGDITAVKYSTELAEVQERFRIPSWEPLMEHYSCALEGVSGQGRLYLTKHHLCYYAELFKRQTALQLRLLDVESIGEESSMLGGSIVVQTRTERHEFKRLPSRTECLQVLTHLWRQERARPVVFGRRLQETLAREQSDIPLVMRASVEYLSRPAALQVQGLFRISPSHAALGALIDAIDDGHVPVRDLLNGVNEHLAAGVLKQYLRDLPQPLLSFELYDLFVTVMALPEEVRLMKLGEAVGHVGAASRHVVAYLCRFLALVAEHSDRNQMNTENLARVFAPLLLRWKGELTVEVAEETPLCIAAVSSL